MWQMSQIFFVFEPIPNQSPQVKFTMEFACLENCQRVEPQKSTSKLTYIELAKQAKFKPIYSGNQTQRYNAFSRARPIKDMVSWELLKTHTASWKNLL